MPKIKVVIGANFGDEGKGVITDYLASKASNGITVRFNGGAQAGHTVVTPASIRHIFAHFGSGSLANLPTYLAEDFVVNPILFRKEFIELKKKKANTDISIHPDCIITTPYDMMINQIIESKRGIKRHGSCGIGVFETVVRNRNPLFKISLTTGGDLPVILNEIRRTYLPNRLKELGVNSIPIEYFNLLSNDMIFMNFLADVHFLKANCTLRIPRFLSTFNEIIFEGAQGLLLDCANKEYYPHLTPSSTGMENVRKALFTTGLEKEKIEIIYVTRCYMTRHGVGNFYTETAEKPSRNIIDLTNVHNKYQGGMRFGILQADDLYYNIEKDLRFAKGLNYTTKLGITCLDQIDNKIEYSVNGDGKLGSQDELVSDVLARVGMNGYLSYGMTRDTIVKVGV